MKLQPLNDLLPKFDRCLMPRIKSCREILNALFACSSRPAIDVDVPATHWDCTADVGPALEGCKEGLDSHELELRLAVAC